MLPSLCWHHAHCTLFSAQKSTYRATSIIIIECGNFKHHTTHLRLYPATPLKSKAPWNHCNLYLMLMKHFLLHHIVLKHQHHTLNKPCCYCLAPTPTKLHTYLCFQTCCSIILYLAHDACTHTLDMKLATLGL